MIGECNRLGVRVAAALAASAGLAAAALACVVASYDSRLTAREALDAAVVLGAAANHGEPSPVFAARLDYARDLLMTRAASMLIVTGGIGSGELISEGDTGRRYLIARGVAPERILVERQSRTTLDNLCGALRLGSHHGATSFAIVSDPLHLKRALRLATGIGMRAVPAATPYTRYRSIASRGRFLARETYFFGRDLLRGRRTCPEEGQAHNAPQTLGSTSTTRPGRAK
jgi:uncharacterized SAM-binding protein YcdF (DUF218 family)